ncbi:NFACT family protein [Candidatus Bipolaricaulota bacterium]|nr:NFACT family protein [Candidatus Bipolaricaulota bacterium]
MDGLGIAAVIGEMRDVVQGSVVRSIYQPSPARFVWQLFSRGTLRLFIAPAEATIHLTKHEFAYPKQPSPFTMLMRKHLRGGRIVEISQEGWERVVRITVEKRSLEGLRRVQVIVELVGVRGNLVLVRDDRVIASLRPNPRAVSGREYVPLPRQEKIDPREVSVESIEKILEDDDSPRALMRSIDGIGKETARIIYERAKTDEPFSAAAGAKMELERILDRVTDPIGAYNEGVRVATFFPIDGAQVYPSYAEALDRCLEEREETGEVDDGTRDIRAAVGRGIAKREKTIARLQEWLENAKKAELLQHRADLLMIYQHELPKKLHEVTVNDPASGEDVTIPLDPRKSGLENAQSLYERAKKLRRGRPLVERKLQRLQREVKALQEGLTQVENGEGMSDRAAALLPSLPARRKAPAATSPRVHSIDGYTVQVGKNARQNDAILRTARPDDLWLHARGVPGSHVVIRRHGATEVPQEVIVAAARLAARHSKARHEPRVEVSVTEVKHVRKPKGAPPGLVILAQEDTLTVDPSVLEER